MFQRVTAECRVMSFRYHVLVDKEVDYICKKAFIVLHRITNSKVYQLTQQLQNGAVVPHLDQRGKHGNRPNRNSTAAVQFVIDHISSFPAESSNYSRSKNSSRSYLSPVLSIGKMYSLYCKECYNHKSHTLISL